MHLYLTDCMTPTRSVIGFGCMSSSHTASETYQIQDLFLRLDKLLLESLNLNLLSLIF